MGRPVLPAVLVGLVLLPVGSAGGQLAGRGRGAPLPEARLDVIAARRTAVQLGVGIAADAGTYLRLVGAVAAGATRRGGATHASGRVDAGARFHLDPFAERRWAAYGGAGVSLLLEDGERPRPVLALAVGIEGPPDGPVIPALEVGLGGGVRVGVILRRRRPNHR